MKKLLLAALILLSTTAHADKRFWAMVEYANMIAADCAQGTLDGVKGACDEFQSVIIEITPKAAENIYRDDLTSMQTNAVFRLQDNLDMVANANAERREYLMGLIE